jgi:general secretion pathway protein D
MAEKLKGLIMKHHCLLFLALLFCSLFFVPLMAQEAAPREYQLEEFVSFDKNLSISEAMKILGQFSEKYENKIIVNPNESSASINLVVEKMHWKRALEYIVRANNLSFEEYENYYQIIDKNSSAEPSEKKIDWNTREIEIDATFFEADYNALSEIGVDWSTLSDGKVKMQVAHNAAAQAGQNMFSATFAYVDKFVSVAALIKVFEGHQLGKVIANPQIRIMDRKEGKIQVGNNFFLTTRDFAGNTRFTEYEAGTILTVTPTIIEEGDQRFIHLTIQAEKSSVLEGTNGVVKAITDGNTEVLMLDGEETAMAGLFSTEQNTVRRGIPILKDLPWWVLGIRYVSGYNSVTLKKKELVILLKADIVASLADRVSQKKKIQYYLERKKLFQKKAVQFEN